MITDDRRRKQEPIVVFGIGSGRCGTATLARLLDSQEGAEVGHERPGPALSWSGAEEVVDQVLDWCADSAPGSLIGDVGFYYLSYFQHILRRFPTARFPVLKRDRQQTIASYLNKAGGRNHWMEHDGRRWHWDRWDHCYPKYEARSIEEALGNYWDEYYERCGQLERQHPDKVRVFDISALNSEPGQREILDFVGIDPAKQRLITDLRLNDAETTPKPRPRSPLRRWLRRLKGRS